MNEPWTRDGCVRAEIVNVVPDVSDAVMDLPVKDNQFVKKGDLLMQIDPSHYEIAVEQAQAAVAARKVELHMRRDDAQRRADMGTRSSSRRKVARMRRRIRRPPPRRRISRRWPRSTPPSSISHARASCRPGRRLRDQPER